MEMMSATMSFLSSSRETKSVTPGSTARALLYYVHDRDLTSKWTRLVSLVLCTGGIADFCFCLLLCKRDEMEPAQREEDIFAQRRREIRRLNRKLLSRTQLSVYSSVLDYCSKSKEPITIAASQDKPAAQTAPSYRQSILYMREPKLSFHYSVFGSLAFANPKSSSPRPKLGNKITSPFTGHLLSFCLFSDHECQPRKLSLLLAIAACRQEKYPWEESVPYQVSSIDYVRIRAELLPQINSLLSDFFWPGIEVKDALNYPDYSIVAMYKRKVIGVALMTPVCYITYFLVHPDWQRASIGSMMLYHLITVAPLSDITLHVPATCSAAMILYQQFGFKAEEFVSNFYKKYLPPEAHSSSLHALALRLRK